MGLRKLVREGVRVRVSDSDDGRGEISERTWEPPAASSNHPISVFSNVHECKEKNRPEKSRDRQIATLGEGVEDEMYLACEGVDFS